MAIVSYCADAGLTTEGEGSYCADAGLTTEGEGSLSQWQLFLTVLMLVLQQRGRGHSASGNCFLLC